MHAHWFPCSCRYTPQTPEIARRRRNWHFSLYFCRCAPAQKKIFLLSSLPFPFFSHHPRGQGRAWSGCGPLSCTHCGLFFLKTFCTSVGAYSKPRGQLLHFGCCTCSRGVFCKCTAALRADCRQALLKETGNRLHVQPAISETPCRATRLGLRS